MKKRILRVASIVLSVALILSAFPLFSFVFAATHSVGTAAEFRNYVVQNANDTSLVINITADFVIDSGVESNFAGKLNGNGHIITVTSGSALFNTVSGTINDLGVVSNITAHGNRPYVGIFANVISGTVNNCFAYGTINLDYTSASVSDSEGPSVGGFCGSLTENKTIQNSFSCVSVKTVKTKRVGGFAGVVRDGASISSCYSAGDIDATDGFVAGFANSISKVSFEDTYSSCQIVRLSNDALPSGVNGLYDNQLSLLRESATNSGLKTADLMRTDKLSSNFAITSTAYPALKVFYGGSWANNVYANDIVSVSVSAASFTDADSSKRYEPTDMFARADYLTYDTYIDKTNIKSLNWSINSTACKVYDTVPVSTYTSGANASVGASTDLLRSRFVFAADAKGVILKAEMNGLFRQWHLNVDNQNVYYYSPANQNGTKDNPFIINSKERLNLVRHYCLNTAAYYKVSKDLTGIGAFDPIVSFKGNFNGNNKTLSGIILADDRDGNMGLFSDTLNGSSITNLILANITAVSKTGKTAGALVGSAVGTSMSGILVSTEVDGTTVGGIVGKMNGGSLKLSGVTGLVGKTGKLLGGLVGETTSTVTIQNCYSTAVVISDTASAVAGGLAGKVTSGATITKSYSAALTDAATAKPLIGSGTAKSTSNPVYDEQFYADKSPTAAKTKEEITSSFASDTTNWVTSSTGYPALKKYSSKSLSLRSTEHFIYQQYWQDADGDNSTTGWIPSANFSTPTPIEGVFKIYTVNNTAGYGFESSSDARRAIVKVVSTDNLCIRYAAVMRDDLIPFTYSVVSASGLTDDPRTYVELSYSKDGTNWSASQIMLLCDSTPTKQIYNIPKGSKVRIRVLTADEYAVSKIMVNGTSLTKSGEYYTSSATYDSAVSAVITLKKNTPTWGVRRETN